MELERLRSRLHRYADGDDDAVLHPDALKDVGALLAAAGPDLPLDAARAAGLLLWCRSRHQDEDADHDDLIPALALLEPVWRADPERLPPEIGEFFAEFGLGPVQPTDAWQGPALALAAHSRATADPGSAALAVALQRLIVAATPREDPELPLYLTNLAMSLQDHAELVGSAAGFDEAVTVGRRAMAAFDPADPRRAVPAAATAVALRRRSARTGSLTDLHDAIALGHGANLGVALLYRYEWTGDEADLHEAIAVQRATGHRTNLAAALLVAAEDTGGPAPWTRRSPPSTRRPTHRRSSLPSGAPPCAPGSTTPPTPPTWTGPSSPGSSRSPPCHRAIRTTRRP
ncbi:hypothetical protein ACQP00_23580 [Dactylosporangium sp. CS-047395]|uniref:hypothetical protein n=1 Tax=Dactylosporangium sp. CS-047395 TaxID=3239936 RepID=UPI003D8AD042